MPAGPGKFVQIFRWEWASTPGLAKHFRLVALDINGTLYLVDCNTDNMQATVRPFVIST